MLIFPSYTACGPADGPGHTHTHSKILTQLHSNSNILSPSQISTIPNNKMSELLDNFNPELLMTPIAEQGSTVER